MDVCALAMLPFLPFNLVDRLISELSTACQGQCGQLSHLSWWLSGHWIHECWGVCLFNPWMLWAIWFHQITVTYSDQFLASEGDWDLKVGLGCGWRPNWVSSLSAAPKKLSYLTLHPVEDILEINFLIGKSLSKSSFPISSLWETRTCAALGQLNFWDISADTGEGGTPVYSQIMLHSYHILPKTKTCQVPEKVPSCSKLYFAWWPLTSFRENSYLELDLEPSPFP